MFAFLADRVERIATRVTACGGTIQRRSIGPPATRAQLDKLARRLTRDGGRLPDQLGLLLSTFARTADFAWIIERPADAASGRPELLLTGYLSWDIASIAMLSANDYWWAESIVNGESEGTWHDQILLMSERDGDILSIGTRAPIADLPTYLAHDGTDTRNLVLGSDLLAFFSEWSRLGFLSLNGLWNWRQQTGLDDIDWSRFADVRALLDG